MLNKLVLSDKQLWLSLFYRETRKRSLPYPKYIQPIDVVTAQDVMEWVRHAIILNRSYSSGRNETLYKIDTTLRVTWTKLVRGRWLLIACSDLKLSELVLLDLYDTEEKSTFYFSGPITEALLEDSGSEILIALTVGKKYVIHTYMIRANYKTLTHITGISKQ